MLPFLLISNFCGLVVLVDFVGGWMFVVALAVCWGELSLVDAMLAELEGRGRLVLLLVECRR